jgi:photosystem II stability/assembly factor-like uncharacterized protein
MNPQQLLAKDGPMLTRRLHRVDPSACACDSARPTGPVPGARVAARWVAAAAVSFGVAAGLFAAPAVAAGDAAQVAFVPEARALPNKVLLLDAAKAGKRFVVVGERGRILYSDDDGKSWKVAESPVLTTLTSIAFSDERNGVAVGHRGTVLLTHDGGTTWQGTKVQAKDQNALLSVWTDGKDGIAVGAYGTYIETHDAGNNWVERRILGDDFDRHLNAVVAGKRGAILVAGEAGTLAVSTDGGRSWAALKSPYEGDVLRRTGPQRRNDPRVRDARHGAAEHRQRPQLDQGESRSVHGRDTERRRTAGRQRRARRRRRTDREQSRQGSHVRRQADEGSTPYRQRRLRLQRPVADHRRRWCALDGFHIA